jgi:hypothetical protein
MKTIPIKLQITPTKKQWDVYQSLKEKDIVFFGGGAGGGKSWVICESRLINCYKYKGYRSFIGREELKRLMQSTYITWEKVCQFHKIPRGDWKLNGQYNYIEFKNGSRVDLLDLKKNPSDPFYERLGSLEYTDGAIEEAGEVDSLAFDVLKSRIGRHMNKEFDLKPTLLITGNPKKNWTYTEFYKPWRDKTLPENIGFIQSLYNDNPHTAREYEKQLNQIKDKATKERLMFGNWEYDDDPNVLIDYDNIIDLFTNSVNSPRSYPEKYLSGDLARFGKDKAVLMLWNGLEVYKIVEYDKSGIDELSKKIRELSETEQIPYSHIIVDEDGVGGGVVDTLRGIKGFVNNSTAIKKGKEEGNFQNLKTQCYYRLAEYINDHKIAVKTEDEKVKADLIEELEQVKKKDADKDTKLRIQTKEEIKEKIGRSPDYSDALMMRMYFEMKGSGEAKQFIPGLKTPIQRNRPSQFIPKLRRYH